MSQGVDPIQALAAEVRDLRRRVDELGQSRPQYRQASLGALVEQDFRHDRSCVDDYSSDRSTLARAREKARYNPKLPYRLHLRLVRIALGMRPNGR